MIGPAVQGVLFVGVIYWYTKGMLSIINDYYRDEFKAYIDKDPRKDLILKPTQPFASKVESCTASHIEGLPDVLKSNNQFTKLDGIVIRDMDTASTNKQPIVSMQCNSQPIEEIPGNKKPNIPPEDQLPYESVKLDISPHTRTSQSDLNKHQEHIKPIPNPSKIGQSNYRQMENQQASVTDDGNRAGTAFTGSSGNCFENDGEAVTKCVTSVKSPVLFTPSSSLITTPVNVEATSSSYMPKIEVNGVLVPADVLRKRLEEKLQRETCQPRTVNQMVKYWNVYIDTRETLAKSSYRPVSPPPSSTATNTVPRTVSRAKSTGDISARTYPSPDS